jgi:hypothetical protein
VHLYVPSSLHWTGLHQYTIDFTTAPPSIVPTDTDYDVTFVNTASATPIVVDGSNGGKVSWHGKLWVWAVAYPDFSGYLYGIDPYSGIIQTMIGYGYGCCPAGIFTEEIESEGLDITETSTTGQIHLQSLGDNPTGTSSWTLLNLNVSDVSRL